MFVKIHSAALAGLEASLVTVEVDVAASWPGYTIVGLPDTAIQEAKERIRTAWKNSGLHFPSNSRILVNLAPADVRKEGTAFDLPIAVGLFLASQGLVPDLSDALFAGELALDGTLRHTSGVLPTALFAASHGYKRLFVPAVNAYEASLVPRIAVYAVGAFSDIVGHLQGTTVLQPVKPPSIDSWFSDPTYETDMAHVRGQESVKRALEIAAAGAHNILLSGPPGTGKTLLARTLPSILPRMTVDEAMEVTNIYSIVGLMSAGHPIQTVRPFRAPHHSASAVSLIGGGANPRPGEISLAHRGVLFLDEFPEFPRHCIETLRQPLEDGIVTVSRAQGTNVFPARFMLVASQNPCPCGFAGDPQRPCICSPAHIARYKKKISGPILDRIDLHVDVPRVPLHALSGEESAESSARIRERVEAARERQLQRFAAIDGMVSNAAMGAKEVRAFCAIDEASETLLHGAAERLHLSARSYHRILKLARTIADMKDKQNILAEHISEAIQYRGVA